MLRAFKNADLIGEEQWYNQQQYLKEEDLVGTEAVQCQ